MLADAQLLDNGRARDGFGTEKYYLLSLAIRQPASPGPFSWTDITLALMYRSPPTKYRYRPVSSARNHKHSKSAIKTCVH